MCTSNIVSYILFPSLILSSLFLVVCTANIFFSSTIDLAPVVVMVIDLAPTVLMVIDAVDLAPSLVMVIRD
jgi:hypothetical protein